jgi:hypothetical protein
MRGMIDDYRERTRKSDEKNCTLGIMRDIDYIAGSYPAFAGSITIALDRFTWMKTDWFTGRKDHHGMATRNQTKRRMV